MTGRQQGPLPRRWFYTPAPALSWQTKTKWQRREQYWAGFMAYCTLVTWQGFSNIVPVIWLGFPDTVPYKWLFPPNYFCHVIWFSAVIRHEARARISNLCRSPGIDPPAYATWQAGMTTLSYFQHRFPAKLLLSYHTVHLPSCQGDLLLLHEDKRIYPIICWCAS